MPVTDKDMRWRTKRLWLPAHSFMGHTAARTTSSGAGAAIYVEVADTQLFGLSIAADGDTHHTLIPIPWDFDYNEPMRFRVVFTHESTDADAPIWKVTYAYNGKAAVLVDAQASADETLTFDAHTCSTTDNSIEVTAWKAATIYPAATDFFIGISVECDSMVATANEVSLLGVEMEYTMGGASEAVRKTSSEGPTTHTGPNS